MDSKEKALIRLNTGKQVDFVKYLFAKAKIKELNAIIENQEQAIKVRDITIKANIKLIKQLKEIINIEKDDAEKAKVYKEHLQTSMYKNTVKNKQIKEFKKLLLEKEKIINELKQL